MLKKIWEVKLTRFLTVGVFNTAFDLSLLNAFVFLLHIPLLAANLISASISISTSYFLNHHIVFRSPEQHELKRFLHFFAVTGIGILGIQTLVIYTVSHLLSPHDAALTRVFREIGFRHITGRLVDLNIAKLCAVAAAMAWNFSIYHFVVFKNPETDAEGDDLEVKPQPKRR